MQLQNWQELEKSFYAKVAEIILMVSSQGGNLLGWSRALLRKDKRTSNGHSLCGQLSS